MEENKNTFVFWEKLNEKVDQNLQLTQRLLSVLEAPPSEKKISFPDFCKQYEISRPTAYAWRDRGLIKISKVGGRNYVLTESISLVKKYERKEVV